MIRAIICDHGIQSYYVSPHRKIVPGNFLDRPVIAALSEVRPGSPRGRPCGRRRNFSGALSYVYRAFTRRSFREVPVVHPGSFRIQFPGSVLGRSGIGEPAKMGIRGPTPRTFRVLGRNRASITAPSRNFCGPIYLCCTTLESAAIGANLPIRE